MRALVVAITLLAISPLAMPSDSAFPLWDDLHEFRESWYSKHLQAMGEQPIELPRAGAIFRFTWLRTFHHPIMVRVTCDSDCYLDAVQLTGAEGYSPGEVELRRARKLTVEEASALWKRVNTARIWDGPPEDDRMGTDGSRWIFEAASPTGYVAWDIWTPVEESKFQRYVSVGTFMLELAEFTVDSEDFY